MQVNMYGAAIAARKESAEQTAERGGVRGIPMRATPPAMSCDYPTKGTPQGGILSNIVLNELDWWVASQWENMPIHHEYKTRQNFSCAIK